MRQAFRMPDGQVFEIDVVKGTNLPNGAEAITRSQYQAVRNSTLEAGRQRAARVAAARTAERVAGVAEALGLDDDAAAKLLAVLAPAKVRRTAPRVQP